jgi:hypothetical protein
MYAKPILVTCVAGVLSLGMTLTARAAGGGTGRDSNGQRMDPQPAGVQASGMQPSVSPNAGPQNAGRGGGGMAGGNWRGHQGGNGNGNGYRPWTYVDFGYGSPWGSYASAPPEQSGTDTSAVKVYDIAPAVAEASYAEAEVERTYTNLNLMIDRARKDFETSSDYQAALHELNDAQATYEDAMNRVIDHLMDNPSYRNLIQQRTFQDVVMEGMLPYSGVRTRVAEQKMDYGSQASLMEADALAHDSAFQDAKTRLLSAKQTLWRRQADFNSSLYRKPELVAANQSYQAAKSNCAGAAGYLRGALVTRADQVDINAASFGGTAGGLVYSPWTPYFGGYNGFGWPF